MAVFTMECERNNVDNGPGTADNGPTRFAGTPNQLPALAAELVKLKPDVIAVSNGGIAEIVHQSTTTIPIVAIAAGQLDGTAGVRSLAKPGGNVTGIQLNTRELIGKRLELLWRAVPDLRRVAVLRGVPFDGPRFTIPRDATETVAAKLAIRVRYFQFHDSDDLARVFEEMARERDQGPRGLEQSAPLFPPQGDPRAGDEVPAAGDLQHVQHRPNTYPGGAAVSLCNDSPPKSPRNAATQDNNGTLALSYANVSATRLLMRSYTDDVGNLIPVQPDTLLVPPELEETAYGIWRTMNKPDTADNLANFTQSYLRNVIVWDYLTDANAWFLIDSVAAKTCLKWLDRAPLEFALDPTSEFRLESRWRGYMRYSYGFKDWRWIYGNNPS